MNATIFALTIALFSHAAPAQEMPDEAGSVQPAVAVLAPAAPADDKPAEHPSDPGRDLFQKASRDVQRAKSISYRVITYGTEAFDPFTPKVDARVRMVKLPGGVGGVSGWAVRVTGTLTNRTRTNDPFDVCWLAHSTEWLDHGAKKLVERSGREVKGTPISDASAGSVRLEELTTNPPFDKPMRSSEFILEGQSEVSGVACDLLEAVVHLGGRSSRAKWAMGVEDHFPRRIERIIDSAMMKGSMISEVSGVEIEFESASITPEQLRIGLPEGYSEDRKVPAAGPINPASRPDYDGPRGPGDPAMDAKLGGKPVPDNGAGQPAPAGPARPLAPALSFKTADGAEVTTRSLSGKVAVLTFFGSWSAPSRDWHVLLKPVVQPYGEQVRVYALAVRERSAESGQQALDRAGVKFALVPKGDEAAKALGVRVFPAVVVLGPAGEILARQEPARGDDSASAVGAAIRAAIAAAQPGKADDKQKELDDKMKRIEGEKIAPAKTDPK